MKKALTYTYVFIAIFILPALIGLGVAEILLEIYENYSRHWLAGAIVCILTGAIATWFPMLFLIEDLGFFEKEKLHETVLIGGVGGIVAPLIFGFQDLGIILTSILILTTMITVSSIQKALKDSNKAT